MTTFGRTGADGLAAEWERLDTLGRCLAAGRDGREPGDVLLDRLADAQRRVERERADGRAWAAVRDAGLGAVDLDVLACALAPEAEPSLGWLFELLQPGVAQPYPTPALMQELLALRAEEAAALYAALGAHAPLRAHGLVELDGDGPYHPVRPGRGAAARLLGRPLDAAPPGSVPVRLRAGWEDVVLAPDRIAALREYLAWIHHRATVVGAWGARALGGPVALFAGPSGTGKTLVAAVLAGELGWPLYRVDLGMLVSKYIGETEKNLNRLFDAAHGRELVLAFDEADSLFGRRGEVREARDRYANLEVSHLLARIEAHDGPCILTTNLRRHLDPAFLRRFQVVVEFPRPDAAGRAELWARLLPPRAPRAPGLDTRRLGEAVALTGGAIRNAALHAAFLAADEDAPISLEHVAVAVWRELGKDGRERTPAALGSLAAHLPERVHRVADEEPAC